MLKVRIIPTLLYKEVGLVKGTNFDSWRRVGTVLPAVKVYNRRDVDELIIMDIMATHEHRDPDYDAVEQWAADCFVPLTIGGGIHKLEQIKKLLRSGADKVCLNSVCFNNENFITQAAQHFGSQCIVIGLDAKRTGTNTYTVYSHCGKVPTKWSAIDWAQRVEALGAGEILLTSIERDGAMKGYELPLVEQICNAVSIPVIASGGAGSYSDFGAALHAGASAVAAASMFHFTEQTPAAAKHWLAQKGIPVRRINNQTSK